MFVACVFLALRIIVQEHAIVFQNQFWQINALQRVPLELAENADILYRL